MLSFQRLIQAHWSRIDLIQNRGVARTDAIYLVNLSLSVALHDLPRGCVAGIMSKACDGRHDSIAVQRVALG